MRVLNPTSSLGLELTFEISQGYYNLVKIRPIIRSLGFHNKRSLHLLYKKTNTIMIITERPGNEGQGVIMAIMISHKVINVRCHLTPLFWTTAPEYTILSVGR